jgi:hypothetical protein
VPFKKLEAGVLKMVTTMIKLWFMCFVLVLVPFVFNTWGASGPKPHSFRVDPHPTVFGAVQIMVDATNVPSNFYFESVTAVIGFYDSNKQLLFTQNVPFSDRMRGGEIYRIMWRYAPRESAVWIKGETLEWGLAGVEGGRWDIPTPSIEASSEFIEISPSLNPHIVPIPRPAR